MVGGLREIVLRFEFHQHRLSGFGSVGVEICPFPLTWPLAYTTACTTVQAVINATLVSTNGIQSNLKEKGKLLKEFVEIKMH